MCIASRYKNFWLLLCAAGLLAACEQRHDPNGNKVTVNPTPGTSADQPALPVGVDKSPMDMSYYPENYPVLKMQGKAGEKPVARVVYSRPQKHGRTVFGNLVEYGKPWRLGANEATEIEFFRTVTIQQKKVPAGRYVAYCIPHPDKWVVKLNSDLYTWGLKIDSTKDQFAFEIPVSKTNYPYEFFTMQFQSTEPGMELAMMWDSVKAVLPIQ